MGKNKKNKGKPTYKRFYGPQFLLQISGSGLVAPSGMFFNARYSKFHIGNYTDERFKDIFKSERYWKIMNYLSSPNFNAETMMGTLPIQHYVNEALDNHIKDIKKEFYHMAQMRKAFTRKFFKIKSCYRL